MRPKWGKGWDVRLLGSIPWRYGVRSLSALHPSFYIKGIQPIEVPEPCETLGDDAEGGDGNVDEQQLEGVDVDVADVGTGQGCRPGERVVHPLDNGAECLGHNMLQDGYRRGKQHGHRTVEDERGGGNDNEVGEEKIRGEPPEIIEHQRGSANLCGERHRCQSPCPAQHAVGEWQQMEEWAVADGDGQYGHERHLKAYIPEVRWVGDEHHNRRKGERIDR